MTKSKITLLFISALLLITACSKPAKTLNAEYSVTVAAPASQVWALIGGFDTIDTWHPEVSQTQMSEDGKQRTLTLAGTDGVTIVEELVNQADMKYTYSIISGPLPVNDYQSTLMVKSVSDTETKVSWSSSFTAKDVTDEQAIEAITGVYKGGLDSLSTQF